MIREKTKFSRQNRSAAYSSSYKDANVESNEKSENRDTKYITLTAVVDPNCAIDILSMCIGCYKSEDSTESFFFLLLLLLLLLVATKKQIKSCWSFLEGRLKKSKKFTQSSGMA